MSQTRSTTMHRRAAQFRRILIDVCRLRADANACDPAAVAHRLDAVIARVGGALRSADTSGSADATAARAKQRALP